MHRKQTISRTIQINPASALRYAFTILMLLTGCDVLAQMSGSVSLVSDYRFRGVSLSQGRPASQINLTYDSPAGWYAGAFASKVSFPDSDGDAQLVAYGGYARQLPSGLRWEAGASDATVRHCACNKYAEIFTGLSIDNISAKLYFSPNYFGRKERTVYADVNASYPLLERLHLIGHIGFLHAFSAPVWPAIPTVDRVDSRLGISAGLTDWNVQLAWVAAEKNPGAYLQYGKTNPRSLVLSALYSF